MEEASLLARSVISHSIYNLDSARYRNPSLEKRKEGWTEVWGSECSSSDSDAWSDEQASISSQLASRHPQLPITLVQHRPAWFEQLVLRMAGIPHIVVNSPYVATEATGSLPYLRDVQPSKPPVLVGRRQPAGTTSVDNCILDYLQTEGYVDLDDAQLTTPQIKSRAHMIRTLIQKELDPIVVFLRFKDDDAWRQVYRPQYLQAASGGSSSIPSSLLRPRLFAWFQAWSVRTMGLKQCSKRWTIQEACNVARKAYQSLEALLVEQEVEQRGALSFLGTEKPTTVDALVWAHLADALCDVHLVIVLVDFPYIVKFVQRTYETYLGVSSPGEAPAEEWMLWNQQENAKNAFQQLPLEESSLERPSHFHDALELMQSLSVHKRDLQEVLTVTKQKRLQTTRSAQTARPGETLYRWRMGGELYPPRPAEETATETPQQEKWRKDTKHNDELWLSGVIVATVLALVLGAQHASK